VCTITFTPPLTDPSQDERWVFFNRDERRNRAAAVAPEVFETPDGRYIAPLDPQGGGTWLGLHSNGWCVCLLNYYPEDKVIYGPQYRSRGLLVKDILDHGRIPDNRELSKTVKEGPYPPFSLYIIWKDKSQLYQWDQKHLVLNHNTEGFLTSSGYQNSRIFPLRQAQFQNLQSRQTDDLREFHRKKHPRGDEGIWMERPDACTPINH
jgi:uncharacterized protein with NRDE domain